MSLAEITPTRGPVPVSLARPVVGAVLIAVLAADDRAHGVAFWCVAGAGMAYALAMVLPAARAWTSRSRNVLPTAAVDAALLLAAAEATGGASSPAALSLSLIPLSLALRLRASDVAAATALLLLGTALLWGLRVGGSDDATSRWLTDAVLLSWTGLTAAFIAAEYQARTGRIAELATASRQLTTQLLDAERYERERLADDLHDDVLQILLATRQDVQEALDGDHDAVLRAGAGVDVAARQLQATVTELRGERLRAGGLAVALRTLANHSAGRRGYTAEVLVDDEIDASYHLFVLSLIRDVLHEVDRHPGGRTVTIEVRRGHDRLDVTVRDDAVRGARGPATAGPDTLAATSRLAWSAERVRAVGGRFAVRELPGGGLGVLASVPTAGDPETRTLDDMVSGTELLPPSEQVGHLPTRLERTQPTNP